MSAQEHKARTTLLRAYLLSMLGVAILFIILAVGIWVYTDDVLDSEKTLISVLLPELDSAYQLTATTASLQSRSALLRVAGSNEKLFSRRAALIETIEQAAQAIDALDAESPDTLSALTGEVEKISQNIDALVASRARQLQLGLRIESERAEVLDQIKSLEKLMQLRVVSLTEQSYKTDSAIAASDELTQSTESNAETLTDLVWTYETTNLAIQDYLLLEQGTVSLSALVERLPLLVTNASD